MYSTHLPVHLSFLVSSLIDTKSLLNYTCQVSSKLGCTVPRLANYRKERRTARLKEISLYATSCRPVWTRICRSIESVSNSVIASDPWCGSVIKAGDPWKHLCPTVDLCRSANTSIWLIISISSCVFFLLLGSFRPFFSEIDFKPSIYICVQQNIK